jgi:hypothetical protein
MIGMGSVPHVVTLETLRARHTLSAGAVDALATTAPA